MFSSQKLKERRKKLGLSQAQTADKLGISRPSYFKLGNWQNKAKSKKLR